MGTRILRDFGRFRVGRELSDTSDGSFSGFELRMQGEVFKPRKFISSRFVGVLTSLKCSRSWVYFAVLSGCW